MGPVTLTIPFEERKASNLVNPLKLPGGSRAKGCTGLFSNNLFPRAAGSHVMPWPRCNILLQKRHAVARVYLKPEEEPVSLVIIYRTLSVLTYTKLKP